MGCFTRPMVVVLTSCALLGLGCAKMERERADMDSAPAAPSVEAKAQTVGADQGAQTAEADSMRPVPNQRKLIQNAKLQVEVPSYAEAREAIDRQLREAGGYLANAQVEHRDGRVSRATLVLRIPADELEAFLRSGASLGEVLDESIETQDITDQYTDLDARLRSAKKLESRLIELLEAKTDGVKDLLEVERELARVREKIESMEGKLRLYDKQVAFSTLTLQIITSQPHMAGVPIGLWARAVSVLHASWSALVSLGKGLVLMLAGLLPWLPLLLAAGWLARRMWRRLARQLRARPNAAPQVPTGPWSPTPPAAPTATPQ